MNYETTVIIYRLVLCALVLLFFLTNEQEHNYFSPYWDICCAPVIAFCSFVFYFLSPCCSEGEGGGEGAEVVAGGHCLAVGSGAAEGYE